MDGIFDDRNNFNNNNKKDKFLYVIKGNKFGNIVDEHIEKMLDEINDVIHRELIDIHKEFFSGKIDKEKLDYEKSRIMAKVSSLLLTKYANILKYIAENGLEVGLEIPFDEIFNNPISSYEREKFYNEAVGTGDKLSMSPSEECNKNKSNYIKKNLKDLF